MKDQSRPYFKGMINTRKCYNNAFISHFIDRKKLFYNNCANSSRIKM